MAMSDEDWAIHQMQTAYDAALRRAIRQNDKFLKLWKNVQNGKIKPPQYYIDTNQVEKWKRGFLNQAMRQQGLIASISSQLDKAGGNSQKILKDTAQATYTHQYGQTVGEIEAGARRANINADFGMLNTRAVKTAVSEVYDDPKHAPFAKIAYENLGNDKRIRHRLQNEMAQAIAQGESQRKVIERIRRVVGNEAYNAKRTAQTEGTRIRSQARNDVLTEARAKGIRIVVEWSTNTDGKARQTHEALNGKMVYQGDDFVEGILAFPGDPRAPAHEVINCRCVLISHVLKSNEQLIDGKIVANEVPAEKKLALDDEAKRKMADDLKYQSNMKFMNKVQKDRYDAMIDSLNDKQLCMFHSGYGTMASSTYDSDVHYDRRGRKHTGAAYWPSENAVHMDIRKARWQDSMGYDSTLATRTYFHENMHKFDKQFAGENGYILTDVYDSPYGKRMKQAILDDTVSLINRALEKYGPRRGLNHIDDVSEINNRTQGYVARYLRQELGIKPHTKQSARVSIITDAISCATDGRICLYDEGYWGHDKEYCTRGVSAATSEVWAQYGGYWFGGYNEPVEAMRSLFPSTESTYGAIYDELSTQLFQREVGK